MISGYPLEIARSQKNVINGKYNEEIANKYVLKRLTEYGDAKNYSFESDDKVIHKIYGHYFLKFENYHSYIVAAVSRPEGWFECHACAPMLSFFEFKQNAAGWCLGTCSICALNDGSWGKPPNEIKIIPIGKNNYGVVIEHKGNNQGVYVAYTRIFADLAGEFKEVFSDQTSYFWVDSPNPKPKWNAEITIKNNDLNFYDILVEKRGVGIPKSESKLLFKFDGQNYKKSEFYK